jgi:hypothetical protein
MSPRPLFTRTAPGLLAVLLAVLAHPALACPGLDPDARPMYGEITVSAGRGMDPFRITTRGGGSWNLRDCGIEWEGLTSFHGDGLVERTPAVVLRWLDRARLAITVENQDDTLLVVRDPAGGWHFDDNGRGQDPLVVFDEGEPGDYAIWIGSHGTNALVRLGELIVTSKGP